MLYIKELLTSSVENQRATIAYISSTLGLPQIVIEKDLWVTVLLHILFGENGSKGILFKGGTSLSKGFNLIDRFSEDIDVTYSLDTLKEHYGDFRNPWDYFENTQNWTNKSLDKALDELKKIGQKYTDDILLNIIKDELSKITYMQFNVMSEGEMTLYIEYPKVLDEIEYLGEYIKPVIKIEAGVRSARTPTIRQTINSYFEQLLGKSDPIEVEILRPDRTFWEKATILHAENSRNEPSRIEKRNHMSRHIYDLVQLYNSKYGQMAIDDLELLADVVRHKSTFYKDNKADYANATPMNLRIVPTPELNDSFKADYEDMSQSMIVGNPPSYDELLVILRKIEFEISKRNEF